MLCKDAFEWFRCNLPHVPGNYLEFGVFNGDGLRTLALLYPEKMFYGIDPFIEDGNTWPDTGVSEGQAMPRQRQNAITNTSGISNIKLFIETSKEFAKRFDAPNQSALEELKLGSIFVDGSHHYEDVSSDCAFASRALPHGGVVVFDDLYLPDVARALDEFKNSLASRLSSFERFGGACAVVRIKP